MTEQSRASGKLGASISDAWLQADYHVEVYQVQRAVKGPQLSTASLTSQGRIRQMPLTLMGATLNCFCCVGIFFVRFIAATLLVRLSRESSKIQGESRFGNKHWVEGGGSLWDPQDSCTLAGWEVEKLHGKWRSFA